MSNDAAQGLKDARLLLEGFTASPWRQLDVALGPMRLSISRMTAAQRPAGASPSAWPHIAGVENAGETVLSSPHVATLLHLAAAGSTILKGDAYATVEVLDERIELRADNEMLVISCRSRPGDLIEFASPLLAVVAL